MKKFCFLLFIIFFIPPILKVLADPIPVISEDEHLFTKCIRIVNLKDFPDIVLITIKYNNSNLNPDPSDKPSEALFWSIKPILSDKCLDPSMRSYSDIYWTTREKFKKIDLKNLTLDRKLISLGDENGDKKEDYVFEYYPKDFNFLATFKDFGPVDDWEKYIDNSDPRTGEIIDYRLYYKSDGSLSLIKSDQRDTYGKIEFEILSNASFKNRLVGVFNSIINFFSKLFGRSKLEYY